MRRVFAQVFHGVLLTVITAAIVWAMVGPEEAGIYHNPLAVVGLGLIGLGLCKSHRDHRLAVAACDASDAPEHR